VWIWWVRCDSQSGYLQHCKDLCNFSSMMAIVVAGLGSAPIRRLQQTWGQLPKSDMETFKEMDAILDSKVAPPTLSWLSIEWSLFLLLEQL